MALVGCPSSVEPKRIGTYISVERIQLPMKLSLRRPLKYCIAIAAGSGYKHAVTDISAEQTELLMKLSRWESRASGEERASCCSPKVCNSPDKPPSPAATASAPPEGGRASWGAVGNDVVRWKEYEQRAYTLLVVCHPETAMRRTSEMLRAAVLLRQP